MPMDARLLLVLMMSTSGVDRRGFEMCPHPELAACVVPVEGTDRLWMLRICCKECAVKAWGVV